MKTTARLQKYIKIYTIIIVLITLPIISWLTINPLYNKLRILETRSLALARDTGVIIIEEYISKLSDISRQVSSRLNARQILVDYESAKNSQEITGVKLEKILYLALKSNTQLIAIARFDSKNKLIAQVGSEIPTNYLPKAFKTLTPRLIGPYIKDYNFFIAILSPILNENHEQVGSDFLLFNATDLQNKIQNKIQYPQGQIIIAYLDTHAKVHLHSPTSTPWTNKLINSEKIKHTLVGAINNHTRDILKVAINDIESFVSFSNISNSSWAFAIIVKKSTLFKIIEEILHHTILTIIIITLLLLISTYLFLKPVSKKMLTHAMDLEERITQSQIELAKASQDLEKLTLIDPLTNTLNRFGFENAFKQESSYSKRHEQKLTLLFINLNSFKKVNDRLGHSAGDIVLQEFAKRLIISLRKEDIVARINGDEFVVMARNLTNEQTQLLKNKIYGLMKTPIYFEHGETIDISARIGIAIYPDNGITLDTLTKHTNEIIFKEK